MDELVGARSILRRRRIYRILQAVISDRRAHPAIFFADSRRRNSHLPEPEQALCIFGGHGRELPLSPCQLKRTHRPGRKSALQDRAHRLPAQSRCLAGDKDAIMAKALHQRANDLNAGLR